MLPPVRRFQTCSKIRIYQLPMEVFPSFVAYAYLVLTDGVAVLLDAGSGFGESPEQLLAGFTEVRERFGEAIAPTDLTRIIITHGHIDHFGGLTMLRHHTSAPIGIHELDRRVLQNYEERLVIASKNLRIFFERAGVRLERRDELMTMYTMTKHLFHSVDVGFTIHDGDRLDDLFHFTHTPGHCPGQVCIQVEDVLFTGDHILARTTPHQAPESITRYTGLGHYLDALERIARIPGVDLALGGHEEPIEDLAARIATIRDSHQRKLERTLEICRTPMTISEVSRHLFPKVSGYNVLLALEEAGAHVEYLYDRGALALDNLEEIASTENPALRYRRL
ncbi:MAG TPA: MBL fold metallo-hydrolase [Chloroflexi bacterium]|nr:MBL fold metallo-hydrolase [Chloroflexota bacterium]